MKRILFVLSILFTLLTFAGAGYVILNKGTVNAGFAVIPMACALALIAGWRSMKD